MRYLRCKCGACEAWTTDGEIPCQGCTLCNTTLNGRPDDHKTPEPHVPRNRFSSDTGKLQSVYCDRCLATLPMPKEDV